MEDNRLVAEFMAGVGVETHHDRYDTSWDELMPVVERINNTGKAGGIKYGLFDALGNADLARAYKEVVGFIKWYNENKGL